MRDHLMLGIIAKMDTAPKLLVKRQTLYVVFGNVQQQVTVHDQRLLVVIGRNTTQVSVRDQRLFVVFDTDPS